MTSAFEYLHPITYDDLVAGQKYMKVAVEERTWNSSTKKFMRIKVESVLYYSVPINFQSEMTEDLDEQYYSESGAVLENDKTLELFKPWVKEDFGDDEIEMFFPTQIDYVKIT